MMLHLRATGFAPVTVKYVNLQFPGKAARLSAFERTAELLPKDESLYPCKAGGALAIGVDTPGIIPEGDLFDEQVEKLSTCFSAIRKLVEWLEYNRQRIANLLG